MIPKWLINIKLFFGAVFVFIATWALNNKYQRNKGKQEEQTHNALQEFEAYKRRVERDEEVTSKNRRINRDELFGGLRAYADKDGE